MSPAKNDDLQSLLSNLHILITHAHTEAVRAVDHIQVQTCWEIGHHIVEFEQGGTAKAAYGKKRLSTLAENLTVQFGKGFDERNLRYMRAFYFIFPIRNALRSELSWTHYRTLLRVDNEKARDWYIQETITQNWSSRALERQIGTLYYERLLASQDKETVMLETKTKMFSPGI